MSAPFHSRGQPPEGDAPSGREAHDDGPDDAFLARDIADGDAAALDRLISRYWIPLASYASRILDDMPLAEDVVQSVFIRVWERRESWRPRSVKASLYLTTRNLSLDFIRSREARRRRERAFGAQRAHRSPTPLDLLDEHEVARTVDAAIQALPDRRREAFTLVYLKELAYAEAAEVMGVSRKTIGHHVSAALTELRQSLDPLLAERVLSDS